MTATERDRLVMLETKVDNIDTKLDKVIADHEDRIRCLESKPGKRWDTIIIVIISNIVVATITFIVSRFS